MVIDKCALPPISPFLPHERRSIDLTEEEKRNQSTYTQKKTMNDPYICHNLVIIKISI